MAKICADYESAYVVKTLGDFYNKVVELLDHDTALIVFNLMTHFESDQHEYNQITNYIIMSLQDDEYFDKVKEVLQQTDEMHRRVVSEDKNSDTLKNVIEIYASNGINFLRDKPYLDVKRLDALMLCSLLIEEELEGLIIEDCRDSIINNIINIQKILDVQHIIRDFEISAKHLEKKLTKAIHGDSSSENSDVCKLVAYVMQTRSAISESTDNIPLMQTIIKTFATNQMNRWAIEQRKYQKKYEEIEVAQADLNVSHSSEETGKINRVRQIRMQQQHEKIINENKKKREMAEEQAKQKRQELQDRHERSFKEQTDRKEARQRIQDASETKKRALRSKLIDDAAKDPDRNWMLTSFAKYMK